MGQGPGSVNKRDKNCKRMLCWHNCGLTRKLRKSVLVSLEQQASNRGEEKILKAGTREYSAFNVESQNRMTSAKANIP